MAENYKVPSVVETLMDQDANEAKAYLEAVALLREFNSESLLQTA